MQLLRVLIASSLLLALVPGSIAVAQVPPHQPGTVCYTPNFWCWMQYPLYPGSRCFCPSPYGAVAGVAG